MCLTRSRLFGQYCRAIATTKVKEVERLKEVEAAVNLQTMEFLEKKKNQLQDEVDAWEERQASSSALLQQYEKTFFA